MHDQHLSKHDQQRIAVFDYLHEHAIVFPHHASDSGFALADQVLRQALHSIPDEFHAAAHLSAGERFVQSVIAEAKHLGKDAYHVAEFALDLVS